MPIARLSTAALAAVASVLLALWLPGAASAGGDRLERRPVPDYDRRGPEPTDAGDVLVWIPRILLFPLHFVAESVVRRPLGALVTHAENERWPATVISLFSTETEYKILVLPTAYFDFGLHPSVGLYLKWRDLLFEGNDLRLRGGFGGEDWLTLRLRERYTAPDELWSLGVEGEATTRPDWRFRGEGPVSRFRNGTTYFMDWFEGRLSAAVHPWRESAFVLHSGARHTETYGGGLGRRIAAGDLAPPAGFGSETTWQVNGARVEVDSRKLAPSPGDGFRVEALVEHGYELDAPSRSWIRYGGAAGGFIDLTGERRVLGLSVMAELADPLGDAREVPFTQQVWLGGDILRGFLERSLVGRSAAVASLEYRWPVWIWLDGTLQASAGNVFGPGFEGFRPGLLRGSFALGIRAPRRADYSLDLLFALGTEPFEDGGAVESFRFVLGLKSGF